MASPAPGSAASTEWTALSPAADIEGAAFNTPLPRSLLADLGSPFRTEPPCPSQCSVPL